MRMYWLAPALSSVLLTSCAGMVLNQTPLPPENGMPKYLLYTVYGGLDGTKPEAEAALDRRAKQVCGGGYRRVSEAAMPRITGWGAPAPSGQHDLHWTVLCTSASPS